MNWSSMFFEGWDGIIRVLVVGPVAYLSLILFLRVSGKRTLTKLNAFDLVITVALGSTLATILLQRSLPVAEGLAALATLILMQFLVTFLSVRSRGFARAIRSEPTLLVREGEPCPVAMRQERVTMEEALSAIRSSGGKSISDASMVILESDGSASVSLRRRN